MSGKPDPSENASGRHGATSPAEAYEIALENMRDAIALFDGAERLVLANGLYHAMYALTPELGRPGTAFADILAHCAAHGILAADGADRSRSNRAKSRTTGEPCVFQLQTADGRVYEVHERPLPDGGWVSTHTDVTERQLTEARIAYLATHDSLTGLLDFRAFRAAVLEKLERPASEQAPFAVVRLDIAGFRRINETYGQAGGDTVLVELADRARRLEPDFVFARVGGDEFAAVADVDDTVDALASRLEALRREVSRPYRLGHVDLNISVSVGYALAPDHGDEAASLMRRADTARSQPQAAEFQRVGVFDWALERDRGIRLTLAHDILPGIDRQEFALAYQPIVELATGRLVGAEALLRWRHPHLGLVRPDLVISVAEEYGRIAELGEWVLRSATAAARRWPKDLTVSVNVSGMQMRSRGFTRLIRSVLRDTGLAPPRLILEVTESTVLADRGARALMDRIGELGVRFALDDFGTGFASLHYLLKYPFDRIKIDRSFVDNLSGRSDSQAIVEAIIAMAMRLRKDVVVEGIERAEECAMIADWGDVKGQGYLFSPGLPEAQFLAYIAAANPIAAAAG